MSCVSTYSAELLQVEATAFSGLSSAPMGNPAVSRVFNSGMWNGMLVSEAQILDTYLFAHSSLLDEL